MFAKRLCLKAPAKINLYLKITGQRADGYHELHTLMQKLDLYDLLEIELVPESGINLSCPGTDLPIDEHNIIYRAARQLLDRTARHGQGVRIVLRKKIPVAAGLGGGSSDAATILLGLDRMLGTRCTMEELAEMGLLLGADVPFFIYDMAAAFATGIGEKLENAVPVGDYQVLLVNPGISVSTKWAYETFALTSGKKIFNLTSSRKDFAEIDLDVAFCKRSIQPKELINDLETVTADKHIVISKIKQQMLSAGAVGSMMSGSGPTVFGLFATDARQQAEQCCNEFKKEYEQVYLVNPLS